jgi:dUTP pyrophosphatase
MEVLEVALLEPHAVAPARQTPGAVGYDLRACEDAVVPPSGGRALVSTGVAVKVPPGTYGRVAPRSGLAVSSGAHVGAGVIDADYRGPVKVLLFNFGDAPLQVRAGDRVAQLILEAAVTPPVAVVPRLDDTARGAAGFGSTGASS